MLRNIGIVASFALLVSLCGGLASAGVSADPGVTGVSAPGTDDFKGKGKAEEKGEKVEKQRKSRSYADKIRGRTKKPPPKKPEEKPKYKKWDEVIKDAETLEGLFKVYKKREDLFFEIRKDQLDKPYLAVLSLSKGIGSYFVLGGMPIDDVMFNFRRAEDHIQIRRLNTLFRASGDPALEKAIDLSYGSSVLFSLPIESEDEKEEKLLVKMNDVFLSDISDVGDFLKNVLRKPARLDAKKAVFEKLKAFPKNVEIEAMLTYSLGDRRGLRLPTVPDPRFIEIGVHYSISELPEEPMKPRLADDRIGFFHTPFKDFTKDDEESFMVHYINRWRLEKKDPDALVSEPKQPIVFYVDHTIPEQYRKYVAEGIEAWQDAFEEAGFKNAIIAKDPPDDPDFDPEDARYNTIRWIVSDVPVFGAIGPSRTDPRTGEILDADILIEANMLANFRRGYKRYVGPEALAEWDPFLRFNDPERADEEMPALPFFEHNHRWACSVGNCVSEGAAFMRLAMLSQGLIEAGMDVPMEYVGEALRWVTTHEVGHTLGLRHNFKSSIATPFDKLNDRRVVEKIGLTGSVMDYAAPNISEDPDYQGYYFSPTLGTYDFWAIKWGYMEVPGGSPEAEAKALEPLAKEAWKTEHAYGADEDAYPAGALDPRCNTFDLGSDPLKYAQKHFRLANGILKSDNLENRVCAEGDNYVPLRSAVETLLLQEYVALTLAVKYVGGQYTERPHKGDPGDNLPLKPLAPEEQRKALNFLVKNAFSTDAFALPPDVLNKLADNKLSDWQNRPFAYGRRFDFPLLGWTGAIQNAILWRLFQPMLLQRVIEAEYKVENPFQLSEMFGSLTKSIWLDNPTPSGRTAAMQRNLQRIYLRWLVRMVVKPFLGTPDDAIALARWNLRSIRTTINSAIQRKGLGDAANAHLFESLARIDRALDAKLQSSF
ncbi:MAG: DUF5117 domain-containing protein [Candidatus Latescibacteria bacterium]|nr:DUF5117 domain-containing protein [Candidatus Latescibacterota bacterium]NIM21842.1 DUF5117 domain-containing protein [Candidatus Latescibacterota bacterium]NIM66213.1 DUF5117 domain-containing protein [Candidatus Latescibacterota bacterium]NIO02737.1 DUF5117 domain-containing protein [Candidatus Latescibacterota bacterium]NIO29279.1 DUF5117 domain-containing protein [Candidatus Latescibacterota bacterium]